MKKLRTTRRYPKCLRARKVAYPSRAEAERCGTILVMIGKWLGKRAYAYQCPECRRWHLTKMKQPERSEA